MQPSWRSSAGGALLSAAFLSAALLSAYGHVHDRSQLVQKSTTQSHSRAEGPP